MRMRSYSASFQNVTVSAIQDLFEIQSGDDKATTILECHITTDLRGNRTGIDMLWIEIIIGHTTAGSGGTTPTVVALDPKSPAGLALGGTIAANNTTIASGGTAPSLKTHHVEAVNWRSGFHYEPLPDCRIITGSNNVAAGGLVVVRLAEAPGVTMNMSGTLYWGES